MMATTPIPTQYTVKAGDTASKIAAQYGVPLSAISGYKSGDANKIGVGETLKITGSTPIPAANTAPASALGGSAFVPAPTTTSVAPTSLLGLAQQTQNNITSLTPKVEADEKNIRDTYSKLGTKASERADLYDSEGVNTAKKELDEITNTMKARENAYKNTVDKIRNENPTGQFEGGQNIQLDKISKDHASEMADLAIVAEAKQGNFTTAKAIVDAKVDAETEDLRTQLESFEFFYKQNYNQLSSDQKTLLEQQTDVIKTELQDKKDLLEKIGSIQLAAAKNGASAATVRAIGKAGSVEDAITLAGSSISDSSRDDGFTTTQLNSGAASAGMSQSEFKALPADVQNYFINNDASAKAYAQAVSDILSGDQDYDDFVEQLNNSYLSQSVKDYLITDLAKRVPQGGGGDSGGGVFSTIGNFFKGAYSSLFGGGNSSGTSTTTPQTK